MPSLTGLTLVQMRSATQSQLVAAITARFQGMTKAQIIRAELIVRDIDMPAIIAAADDPIISRLGNGRESSRVDVDRDAVSAALIQTRTVTHTYYANGDVDTITIVMQDGAGAETSRKTIKHYQDGRQPTVS